MSSELFERKILACRQTRITYTVLFPNAWRFQEYYFLIWNPIKDCFSDSWILKSQANPIRWMVLIIIVESIESNRTFVSTLKMVRAKFQTSNLRFRFVKANCLEQKWIISWFQRPQMGGGVFLSVRPSVTKFWYICNQFVAAYAGRKRPPSAE